MTKGVSFTSSSAPRNGRVKGSKNRLSKQARQILDRLMVDWTRHGAGTLKILRLEAPAQYARLSLEIAAKLALNDAGIDDGAPTLLVVRWGTRDPAHPMPLPPEPIREFSPTAPTSPSPQHGPTMTPASPAKLLTLLPRPPA